MKFMANEDLTIGHIPKYLSALCFKFVDDGGDIDAEGIGKRFNAGHEMGTVLLVNTIYAYI